MLTPWKESSGQPRQHIKKQRRYFTNKGPSSQGYGFASGHVCMWELDYKESWTIKKDVEAETSVLWPPDEKSWLIGKDPDAGKDWGQEEEGMTEDEMVGWHYWLDGVGFGWTLGAGVGQGGLACCGSWGCTVGHDWVTELNWTWSGEGELPFGELTYWKTYMASG